MCAPFRTTTVGVFSADCACTVLTRPAPSRASTSASDRIFGSGRPRREFLSGDDLADALVAGGERDLAVATFDTRVDTTFQHRSQHYTTTATTIAALSAAAARSMAPRHSALVSGCG